MEFHYIVYGKKSKPNGCLSDYSGAQRYSNTILGHDTKIKVSTADDKAMVRSYIFYSIEKSVADILF